MRDSKDSIDKELISKRLQQVSGFCNPFFISALNEVIGKVNNLTSRHINGNFFKESYVSEFVQQQISFASLLESIYDSYKKSYRSNTIDGKKNLKQMEVLLEVIGVEKFSTKEGKSTQEGNVR